MVQPGIYSGDVSHKFRVLAHAQLHMHKNKNETRTQPAVFTHLSEPLITLVDKHSFFCSQRRALFEAWKQHSGVSILVSLYYCKIKRCQTDFLNTHSWAYNSPV